LVGKAILVTTGSILDATVIHPADEEPVAGRQARNAPDAPGALSGTSL
jgi:hypothetical protein